MKKQILLISMIVILTLSFSTACTRSATSIDTNEGAKDLTTEFPVLTEIAPSQLPFNDFATMTAQASMLTQTAEATPDQPAEESTPQDAEETTNEEETETDSSEEEPTITATLEPTANTQYNNLEFEVFDGYNPGVPLINIYGVIRNVKVVLEADNFPANQTFQVKMNYMGTMGVDGVIVGDGETGAGGGAFLQYSIPEDFMAQEQIAIRVEFSNGYYAFNWFYNTTTD